MPQRGLGGADLDREVREGFPEEVTFELRPEGFPRVSQEWSVPGSGNGRCKGPVAGPCLGILQIARRLAWVEEE